MFFITTLIPHIFCISTQIAHIPTLILRNCIPIPFLQFPPLFCAIPSFCSHIPHFILHNNLFNNQGSEINKNDIFLCFDILSFTKTFFLLLTLLYSILSPILSLAINNFPSHVLPFINHLKITRSKFYSNKNQTILLYIVCHLLKASG